MNLPIKLLYPNSKLPVKSNEHDAGFDLFLQRLEVVPPTDDQLPDTLVRHYSGIAVSIPVGYVGLLFMRSSVYKTPIIFRNAVGVIDSGYVGEISAICDLSPSVAAMVLSLSSHGAMADIQKIAYPSNKTMHIARIADQIGNACTSAVDAKTYRVGERFAQLVILPIAEVELQQVGEFDETTRGTKGFGSTGN